MSMNMNKIMDVYQEHKAVMDALFAGSQAGQVEKLADFCRDALQGGHCLYFMGNGGSAADSQHLAAEFVGRFQKNRRGLPAQALTTNTSILTAAGNDFGFDLIFSRQIEAMVRPGDVVIGISTSGTSPNVVEGLRTARAQGAVTVGLMGQNAGTMAEHSDLCIQVPSPVTARVQEAHILIGHIVCQLVEEALTA